MLAATQRNTASVSMTLGMPGELAGAGSAPPQAGSPEKRPQGRPQGRLEALSPSATVYRRPFRCADLPPKLTVQVSREALISVPVLTLSPAMQALTE